MNIETLMLELRTLWPDFAFGPDNFADGPDEDKWLVSDAWDNEDARYFVTGMTITETLERAIARAREVSDEEKEIRQG